MTKKDYIKFANLFQMECAHPREERRDEAKFIALKVADIFENDNPNFNRKRFLEACGITVA